MNAYVDSNGRSIPLDHELGRGGEGAVFAVRGRPELVAKIYNTPPSAQTAEKLLVMVSRAKANAKLLEVSAWPQDLLYHVNGTRLAGFLMPRIDGCQSIQQLYNPRRRLQCFPQASWKFQVRAARNLAAAFDEVHKAGCLVGDVNERNIQISSQALVRLVDCDSFQIQANGKSFLCEVGVPQYIPPEIQGRSLIGLIRTENHDRFGLAVLIYQLVFVGRHPYQGLYTGNGDPTIEQLIREFRFAQGPAARNWSMAPPPYVPTFADIPSNLATLFRQAFERGSENNNRPRPESWLIELKHFENSLAICPHNPGHLFWPGAGGCAWCRFARNGGPEYYYVIGEVAVGFSFDERKLQDVLGRLARAERITFVVNRNDYLPKSPIVVTQLSPLLTQLRQNVLEKAEVLRLFEREAAAQERADAELATANLRQYEDFLKGELGPRMQNLEGDVAAAIEAVAKERWWREIVEALLLGAALIGACAAPFAIFHWAFALIGVSIAVGFGTWFSVFHFRAKHSPGELRVTDAIHRNDQIKIEYTNRRQAVLNQLNAALRQQHASRSAELTRLRAAVEESNRFLHQEFHRELEQSRQAKHVAEQQARVLEGQLQSIVESHLREQHIQVARVQELVAQCRLLTPHFESEFKRITENAEEAARTQHLRLYSINDADIPGIGFGRKQILATHLINSAADINEDRIRQISGFGEVLTGKLLEWRAEVLQQFHFNPRAISSSAEMRALVVKYRDREKKSHSEMESSLGTLESLAGKCRGAINAVVPALRRAWMDYEQAKVVEANLLAAFSNRQSR